MDEWTQGFPDEDAKPYDYELYFSPGGAIWHRRRLREEARFMEANAPPRPDEIGEG